MIRDKNLVSFFLLNLTLSFDYSSAIKCDILDFETILRDTLFIYENLLDNRKPSLITNCNRWAVHRRDAFVYIIN